jgi:hypothetical protein
MKKDGLRLSRADPSPGILHCTFGAHVSSRRGAFDTRLGRGRAEGGRFAGPSVIFSHVRWEGQAWERSNLAGVVAPDWIKNRDAPSAVIALMWGGIVRNSGVSGREAG